MRKPLHVLALFALAAVASANSLSQGSSYTTATFSATAGLTLNSITDQEYNPPFTQASDPSQTYQLAPGVNFLDLDAFANGDRVAGGPDGATAQLGDNTTSTLTGNRVSVSVENQLQLASATTTNTVAEAALGHREFLTFKNPSATEIGHVKFDVQLLQSCLAHADVPFGGGPYGIADYADPTAFGGVAEVTFDANGQATATSSYNRFLDVNTDNGADAFDTLHASFSHTFDIAPGATRTYDVFALVDATTAHANPVPEPSALAALGLGALAFLRRRRA